MGFIGGPRASLSRRDGLAGRPHVLGAALLMLGKAERVVTAPQFKGAEGWHWRSPKSPQVPPFPSRYASPNQPQQPPIVRSINPPFPTFACRAWQASSKTIRVE